MSGWQRLLDTIDEIPESSETSVIEVNSTQDEPAAAQEEEEVQSHYAAVATRHHHEVGLPPPTGSFARFLGLGERVTSDSHLHVEEPEIHVEEADFDSDSNDDSEAPAINVSRENDEPDHHQQSDSRRRLQFQCRDVFYAIFAFAFVIFSLASLGTASLAVWVNWIPNNFSDCIGQYKGTIGICALSSLAVWFVWMAILLIWRRRRNRDAMREEIEAFLNGQ